MITDVLRIHLQSDYCYIGSVRSEYNFKLGEHVYLAASGIELIQCEVVGIEALPVYGGNREYKYKLQLPRNGVNIDETGVTTYDGRTFNQIFRDTEEAKKEITRNLDKMYNHEKEKIESYFKSFEQ